jgi:hypothetical protein
MGAVRRLANVTGLRGRRETPSSGRASSDPGWKEVGRSPQNQILRARETIATAGYTKLLITEIGVFRVATAVNFSRMY